MDEAAAIPAARLEQDGFCVVPDVLPEALRATLAAVFEEHAAGDRGGLQHAAVQALVCSEAVQGLARSALGGEPFAVRATLFNKTPEANWFVAWHQDITVAVRERREVPGFRAWSSKNGVQHAQAPRAVLEGMLAIRVGLDAAGPEDGALRVVPGSHRSGVLAPEEIAALHSSRPALVCAVPAHGALAMRPLLLHSSPRAARPEQRRVVHLEFACAPLPGGLQWNAG